MVVLEWLKNHFQADTEENLQKRIIGSWRCAVELEGNEYDRARGYTEQQLSICIEDAVVTIDNRTLSEWVNEDIKLFGTDKPKILRCRMYDGLSLCSTCFGSGKLDWARRAKNKPIKIDGISVHDSDYIKFIPSERINFSDCGTKAQCLPELYDGEKYCYRCGASGMMFKNYYELFPDKLWYEAEFPVKGR